MPGAMIPRPLTAEEEDFLAAFKASSVPEGTPEKKSKRGRHRSRFFDPMNLLWVIASLPLILLVAWLVVSIQVRAHFGDDLLAWLQANQHNSVVLERLNMSGLTWLNGFFTLQQHQSIIIAGALAASIILYTLTACLAVLRGSKRKETA